MVSLTSWFLKEAIFSLLFVLSTRIRLLHLVADAMTAVQTEHRHSLSMSSVEVESSLNLDAMLLTNAVRTSLSANDSVMNR